jgi:hypothetical protein
MRLAWPLIVNWVEVLRGLSLVNRPQVLAR